MEPARRDLEEAARAVHRSRAAAARAGRALSTVGRCRSGALRVALPPDPRARAPCGRRGPAVHAGAGAPGAGAHRRGARGLRGPGAQHLDPEARCEVFLGLAKACAGAPLEAAAALLEASRQGPVVLRVGALLERARLLERGRGSRGAVEGLRALLALSPGHVEAGARLKEALRGLGDHAALADAPPRRRPRPSSGSRGGGAVPRARHAVGRAAGRCRAAPRRCGAGSRRSSPTTRRCACSWWSSCWRAVRPTEAVPLLEEAARGLDGAPAAAALRRAAAFAQEAADAETALRLARRAHALIPADGADLALLAELLYLRGAVAEALPLQAAARGRNRLRHRRPRRPSPRTCGSPSSASSRRTSPGRRGPHCAACGRRTRRSPPPPSGWRDCCCAAIPAPRWRCCGPTPARCRSRRAPSPCASTSRSSARNELGDVELAVRLLGEAAQLTSDPAGDPRAAGSALPRDRDAARICSWSCSSSRAWPASTARRSASSRRSPRPRIWPSSSDRSRRRCARWRRSVRATRRRRRTRLPRPRSCGAPGSCATFGWISRPPRPRSGPRLRPGSLAAGGPGVHGARASAATTWRPRRTGSPPPLPLLDAGAARAEAHLTRAGSSRTCSPDAERAEAALRAALVEVPRLPAAEEALEALLRRQGRLAGAGHVLGGGGGSPAGRRRACGAAATGRCALPRRGRTARLGRHRAVGRARGGARRSGAHPRARGSAARGGSRRRGVGFRRVAAGRRSLPSRGLRASPRMARAGR